MLGAAACMPLPSTPYLPFQNARPPTYTRLCPRSVVKETKQRNNATPSQLSPPYTAVTHPPAASMPQACVPSGVSRVSIIPRSGRLGVELSEQASEYGGICLSRLVSIGVQRHLCGTIGRACKSERRRPARLPPTGFYHTRSAFVAFIMKSASRVRVSFLITQNLNTTTTRYAFVVLSWALPIRYPLTSPCFFSPKASPSMMNIAKYI